MRTTTTDRPTATPARRAAAEHATTVRKAKARERRAVAVLADLRSAGYDIPVVRTPDGKLL